MFFLSINYIYPLYGPSTRKIVYYVHDTYACYFLFELMLFSKIKKLSKNHEKFKFNLDFL